VLDYLSCDGGYLIVSVDCRFKNKKFSHVIVFVFNFLFLKDVKVACNIETSNAKHFQKAAGK